LNPVPFLERLALDQCLGESHAVPPGSRKQGDFAATRGEVRPVPPMLRPNLAQGTRGESSRDAIRETPTPLLGRAASGIDGRRQGYSAVLPPTRGYQGSAD